MVCNYTFYYFTRVIHMDKKRVISFSLWGNKEIYMKGILVNVDMAKEMYPDFECWVYIHKDTVPEETICELESRNTKIIYKHGDLTENKSMMWRFETIDDPDVEINMSRDCDTIILERECLAVREWINSGRSFHIMRDHPYHDWVIQGGMFGTRKIPSIPSWATLMDNVHQTGARLYDQVFLRDVIYPIVREDALIHASFNAFHGETTYRFPIDYDDKMNFVGQYIYPDGSQDASCVDLLRRECSRKPVSKKMRLQF